MPTYMILNNVNYRIYIGKTDRKNIKGVKERAKEHLRLANKTPEKNILYSDISKYGAENFYIYMLHEEAKLESFYIKYYYDTFPERLYNEYIPMRYNKYSKILKADIQKYNINIDEFIKYCIDTSIKTSFTLSEVCHPE